MPYRRIIYGIEEDTPYRVVISQTHHVDFAKSVMHLHFPLNRTHLVYFRIYSLFFPGKLLPYHWLQGFLRHAKICMSKIRQWALDVQKAAGSRGLSPPDHQQEPLQHHETPAVVFVLVSWGFHWRYTDNTYNPRRTNPGSDRKETNTKKRTTN